MINNNDLCLTPDDARLDRRPSSTEPLGAQKLAGWVASPSPAADCP
ncbi:MAG: hypothetical protein JO069_10270 [Verrucomicrobia bacterium]|nr:hypothetical protein [Verrucomicrobiota bacterium]